MRNNLRKQNKREGNIRFLYGYSKGYRHFLLISLIGTLFGILFMAITPQIIKVTIDSIIGDVPYALPKFISDIIEKFWSRDTLRSALYIPALFSIFFAILAGGMNFLRRNYLNKFSEGAVKALRDNLFSNIQMLPYKWHIKVQTGDIIQRCTSDIDTIRQFLSVQSMEFVRVVVLIAVNLGLMLTIDVPLALVTLAITPIVIAYSTYFFVKTGEQYLKADEAEGALMACAQENLTGVRVVRAFGREASEIEKFRVKNNFFSDLWLKLGKILSVYWALGDFVTGIQISLILFLGVKTVLSGRIDVGAFIAFLAYNQATVWPVRSLGRLISEMSRTGVSVNRVREILESEPEKDPVDAKTPEFAGDIEFKNVSFRYDDNLVLDNVSFKIPAGSTLAILGGTGSGKSTLAHLLTRLYDTDEGCGDIFIDNINIKEIKRGHLRKKIGLVLQEPFLFSKTIIENIKSANEHLALDDVRKYARFAAVDDNIISFPHEYDTMVGERGVTLSGGQKQRVAIARMLASDPKIMIFDDSFSAIDTETDSKIRGALKKASDGATTVLISHRATTLMQADNIIVLKDGKIVEEGNHMQLMELDGIYAQVNNIQSLIEEELA